MISKIKINYKHGDRYLSISLPFYQSTLGGQHTSTF